MGKKPREPLDRSDIIALISLGVAFFGTALSAFFSWQANETAASGNRVAVRAAKTAEALTLQGNNIALDEASSRVILHQPVDVMAVFASQCRDSLLGTNRNYWFAHAEVVVSNSGGRDVSLIDVSAAGIGQDWTTAVYEAGSKITFPADLPSGKSRKWLITAWSSYNEAEVPPSIMTAVVAAQDQLPVVTWIFHWGDDRRVLLEKRAIIYAGEANRDPNGECVTKVAAHQENWAEISNTK